MAFPGEVAGISDSLILDGFARLVVLGVASFGCCGDLRNGNTLGIGLMIR